MIQIDQLHKRFGRVEALRGVSLHVPAGRVHALLGPNGSGKTTTIRCAMNLLERDAGRVEVLGCDARRLGAPQWREIGYVSGNQRLPGWMTVAAFLDYLRPMYGDRWDRDFEGRLLREFELPPRSRLRELSRGQRMKAALLSSLAYRPKLVVLDEPFAGLDPLVREEFLTGLLELTGVEGWTVWISSHDMEEVERFADRVAILDEGRVRVDDELEEIQRRFRCVELTFEGDAHPPERFPDHWIDLRAQGRTLRFTDTAHDEARHAADIAAVFPQVRHVAVRAPGLRELFVSLARDSRAKRATANREVIS